VDNPSREDYQKFVEDFSDSVKRSKLETCFYLYGSFFNEDFCPGTSSDLDGGLILDCEFVTPKDTVDKLAAALGHHLRESEVDLRINFNLMERGVNRDGRFLAYDDTYTDYLKKNARISSGPDFLQEMNGMNYKRGALGSTAYNLRKVRNGLLMHFVNLEEDTIRARKNIFSSRNTLCSTQKKLIELSTGEIFLRTNETFCRFKELFPNYDTKSLEEALSLKRDSENYHKVLGNLENRKSFELSKEFVTATELMIQEYVKQKPEASDFEVRRPLA